MHSWVNHVKAGFFADPVFPGIGIISLSGAEEGKLAHGGDALQLVDVLDGFDPESESVAKNRQCIYELSSCCFGYLLSLVGFAHEQHDNVYLPAKFLL
jgi:hypothetical protein